MANYKKILKMISFKESIWKNVLLFALFGIFGFAFYLGFFNMIQKPLEVIFPVAYLKNDISLIDPENTNTVWEYYLLENLSCGLVRDSRNSPVGYEGCLAEKFFQKDPYTWVFVLRKLKWSDQTEVSIEDIKEWYQNLHSKPHRHIRFLPRSNRFLYEPSTRHLTIGFAEPMDISILHELSQADAGLLPPDFKNKGWSKTVGPYRVESWNLENRTLSLISNKMSPLYSNEMPQKVFLKNLSDDKERMEVFKSISMDIVPVSATSDPKLAEMYSQSAGQVFNSHPSSILFLYFNFENIISHDIAVRKRIEEVIKSFRKDALVGLPKASTFLPETQLIPDGFNGRLSEFEKPNVSRTVLLSSSIKKKLGRVKVRLSSQLKLFPQLVSKLAESFKREGIELEFFFEPNLKFSHNELFGSILFVGNQLDSSGTWSFLLGPPLGPLSPWLSILSDKFEMIFKSKTREERLDASKALHKKILEDAYAIPVFIGHHRYFLSSRVDTSRWNQFDSRLRFYELSYK